MKILRQNWLGIIGLICLCIAIPLANGVTQNLLNVIGILLLVTYAWCAKNEFFFYLELVVLLGAVLKITNVSNLVLNTALVLASVIALARVFKNPANRVWYIGFGLVGLAGLVYGYATLSNLGYAIGGVASMIYSFILFSKGIKSALIFGILNIIYGTLAIYMLIKV